MNEEGRQLDAVFKLAIVVCLIFISVEIHFVRHDSAIISEQLTRIADQLTK